MTLALTPPTAAAASAPGPGRWSLGPGLLAAAAVAGIAQTASFATGLRALPLALGLGLALAGRAAGWAAAGPGLAAAARPLLRLAVVLAGLRCGLAPLAQLGAGGIAGIVLLVAATLAAATWCGRRLGLPRELALLLAAGHAICGAAAIGALASSRSSRAADAVPAIALVTVAGTAAMLLLPVASAALGLQPFQHGVWTGSSLHEVAQVLVAGASAGDAALAVATAAKLVRVACLAPVVWWLGRPGAAGAGPNPGQPWFVLGFAVAAALHSGGLVPETLRAGLLAVGDAALLVAVAALGLQCPLGQLRQAGWRAAAAALLATAAVTAMGFGLAALAAGPALATAPAD